MGFVRGMCDQAGISFVEGESEAVPSPTTVLSYAEDSVHGNIEVKIDAIDPGIYERLKILRDQEKDEHLNVALVYLNARGPKCPECYRFLREFGFIFTGCLPGGSEGDYLHLQHLMGSTFDKGGTVIEPDYASMLEQLYQINGEF